jgi:hypothetical protein
VSDRVTSALACPSCGANGVAVWEIHSNARRDLASITGGFHSEHGRTNDDSLLVICNRCDEILTT